MAEQTSAAAGGRPETSRAVRLGPLLVTLVIGLAIGFWPPPDGVDPKAWHVFAIFVGTVVGFIARPLPMGAVALIGLTLTALTGTLGIDTALSGFSSTTIWLIAVALFVSRAFIKTDVAVVGGGGGLSAAIAAAEDARGLRITLISKVVRMRTGQGVWSIVACRPRAP